MRFGAGVLGAMIALALAACSGTMGSGGGLSLPQTGQNGVPQAAGGPPGSSGTTSSDRQRVLEGSLALRADARQFSLPSVDGFAVSIDLASAPPSPAPKASSPAAPTAGVKPPPSARPSASPSPSALPSAALPSPSAGSPTPAASDASRNIVMKTTIYPNGALPAPTPAATGDASAPPLLKRAALVRGYLMPAADFSLYGLAAVRFTIPKEEQTDGRGFTVAFYETGKKGRDKLLKFDAGAPASSGVIAAASTDPLALKKGTGYAFVLYGDELPATPAPATVAYPSPGNGELVTPLPGGMGAASGAGTSAPPASPQSNGAASSPFPR